MTSDTWMIEWKRALAVERRTAREGAARLINAVVAGDGVAFGYQYEDVSQSTIDGIDRFFRAVARLSAPISIDVRREFTVQWIRHKSARSGTRHDRQILAALRKLLVPHSGPPVRLYRGASLAERRNRSYGISWTSDRQIAERFAENPIARMRSNAGGSGVYETIAPTEAILGTSLDVGDPYGESEYFVDRRRLNEVRTISKFSHLEMEQAAEIMDQINANESGAR